MPANKVNFLFLRRDITLEYCLEPAIAFLNIHSFNGEIQ